MVGNEVFTKRGVGGQNSECMAMVVSEMRVEKREKYGGWLVVIL